MTATPFTRRNGMRAAAAAALSLPVAAHATHDARAAGPARSAVGTSWAAAPSEYTEPAEATRPVFDDGGPELRTMTFNLRYAGDTRPNSWAERRPVTHELLRRERPHLLGTQEGLYAQLQDIESDLGPRYDWIGTGREGGSRSEFGAVFYDTSRLTPLEYDHFWLSDTPYVIGSNTWGGQITRMVTWVRFQDRRTGGRFYALNTHFDHVGQYARERSAALISERLGQLDPALPRIVTGDFNVAAHGNPVYDALLSGGKLVDTWETAAERSPQFATFHGYRPLVPDGDRIDWILTSRGVRAPYAAINTFARDGQFPSDHLPVQAVLDL
ncbi:endonuclease/exonuclease/phosphatase family protein [Streptomyces sp. NPDC051776]|uniref:endonuclease/exonuclease/phosphatase family protein n=1 Tax=Streptomyces sp. NPDC051776 TaxID=3155414 RepID=UPI0034385EE3